MKQSKFLSVETLALYPSQVTSEGHHFLSMVADMGCLNNGPESQKSCIDFESLHLFLTVLHGPKSLFLKNPRDFISD